MNIIIIGCGRFGGHLVQKLHDSNQNFFLIIVDRNEAAFNGLPIDFNGFILVKDAEDLSLFKEVKIQRADAFFAVTDKPNLNFMLAHIAKELYKVPKVAARAPFEDKKRSFESLGVTLINPFDEAAGKMVASIMEKTGD